VSRGKIQSLAEAALDRLRMLLSTGSVAELVRDGAVVVIAGPPNVGKSSLFNALVGHARAIVTDVPGTTRDALEALVDIGDIPLRLIDTAGLRESEDFVEKLGIEVSRRYLSAADIVIACGDTPESLNQALEAVAEISRSPTIAVLTKSDLAKSAEDAGRKRISVSAITGAGLPALLQAVESALSQAHAVQTDTPLLTRARHISAVSEAAEEVEKFICHWSSGDLPATVAAIHIRSAAAALESLIGVVDVEDVLDKVFSAFCVGK
jgi:tRNA modification GTPase